MTGRVVPLRGDEHLEASSLLPWYVTGRLGADERARVEGHLNECAACQAELKSERALRAQIAGLDLGVEGDWAKLRARLERDRRGGGRARLGATARGWSWGARWRGGRLAWALAPALAVVLLAAGALFVSVKPARYHTLGAGPAAPAANVVVMFNPRASEADLRRVLEASGARLVDGPTGADAWLVHVPAAARAAALRRLRAQPQIVLAEPVDSGASR
ncbi:MAG: anti-sigma factor family protein [Caulobacteraceae bacterium]